MKAACSTDGEGLLADRYAAVKSVQDALVPMWTAGAPFVPMTSMGWASVALIEVERPLRDVHRREA
jgi:hypothetical protein